MNRELYDSVILNNIVSFQNGKGHESLVDENSHYILINSKFISTDGEKMGKTATGTLWVSREKTTVFDFFQTWMNSFDEDVSRSLAFFTRLDMDVIDKMCKEDIREAKKLLAFEVTKLVHGEEEALKAKETAEELFSNKGISDNMPTKTIEESELDINIFRFIS